MGSVGREVEAGGTAKGKAGRQALQESRRSGIQTFQDSSRAETRLSRRQRSGIVLGFDGPTGSAAAVLLLPKGRSSWAPLEPGGGRGRPHLRGRGSGRPAPRRSRPRPETRGAAGSGGACAVCWTRPGASRRSGSQSRPRSGEPPGAGRESRGPRGWGRGRRVRAGPGAPLGPLAWRRRRALGPWESPAPPWGSHHPGPGGPAGAAPPPPCAGKQERRRGGAWGKGAGPCDGQAREARVRGAGLGGAGGPGVRCVVSGGWPCWGPPACWCGRGDGACERRCRKLRCVRWWARLRCVCESVRRWVRVRKGDGRSVAACAGAEGPWEWCGTVSET